MIEIKSCMCLSCKWMDAFNAQCFDGHLQMLNKNECEGYEHSIISAKIKYEVQEASENK